MDQIKLIHDFVDGMLDPGQEESLFLALSNSDELRQEMKDLLAMKEAARSYTEVYTPSASSTMAVFGLLGFETPKLAYNSSNLTGWTSRLMNFYRRNSRSFKTGIASSVLTAILVFFLLQPDDTLVNNSSANMNEKAEQAQLFNNSLFNNSLFNYSTKSEVPVVVSTENIPEIVNTISVKADKTVNSSMTSVLHDQNDTENTEPVEAINNDASINTIVIHMAKQFINPLPNSLEFNTSFYIPGTANVSVNDITDFIIEDLAGLSVEIRGSQNWNSEKATINPSEYALFNNYSAALFYDLSEKFSFGIDLRQETFFNKFFGVDEDGIMKTFETQPNYTSLGLALRYYFLQSENFKPLIQGTFGGNSVGLTSRLMAGLKYEPYRNIAFILGLEYSNLTYWFDNNSFNSSKVGLNYGMQYIW